MSASCRAECGINRALLRNVINNFSGERFTPPAYVGAGPIHKVPKQDFAQFALYDAACFLTRSHDC